MSISRRQFFRGLRGQVDNRDRMIKEVKDWVRTHLLPYDFALTDEQTNDILDVAVRGVDTDSESELLTDDRRNRLREIVEGRVQLYREEFLKAEDVRREAIPFVAEFLTRQATPEELQKLGNRFNIPHSASLPEELEEEIERQVRVWLAGMLNSRLAGCSGPELRELVFSELRSWC